MRFFRRKTGRDPNGHGLAPSCEDCRRGWEPDRDDRLDGDGSRTTFGEDPFSGQKHPPSRLARNHSRLGKKTRDENAVSRTRPLGYAQVQTATWTIDLPLPHPVDMDRRSTRIKKRIDRRFEWRPLPDPGNKALERRRNRNVESSPSDQDSCKHDKNRRRLPMRDARRCDPDRNGQREGQPSERGKKRPRGMDHDPREESRHPQDRTAGRRAEEPRHLSPLAWEMGTPNLDIGT